MPLGLAERVLYKELVRAAIRVERLVPTAPAAPLVRRHVQSFLSTHAPPHVLEAEPLLPREALRRAFRTPSSDRGMDVAFSALRSCESSEIRTHVTVPMLLEPQHATQEFPSTDVGLDLTGDSGHHEPMDGSQQPA